MKNRAVLALLLVLPGTSAVSADFGFNPTVAAYVAIPLGAKTKTSFTTWGVRFGEVDTSGYSDERVYSPLNNIPTLSRYMARPALWELKSDRLGISSFMVNGLETAQRSFTLNAAGAVAAATSSINWGMVAAGTAATVAVAAASSSSSGGSGSSSSGGSTGGQPSSTSGSSGGGSGDHGGSGSTGGGSSSPAPSQPAPAQTPPPRADDRDGDHNDDRDNDHHDDRNDDRNDNHESNHD